jgi:RNA polymerase sigma factor (sigma-70 family)
MNATPAEQRNRESFLSQISRELKGLYRFVRHQLAYAESVGDLVPGERNAEEIVDEALLQAYREFVKEPDKREIGAWLIELAKKRIQADVKRSRTERNLTVHIEEDIPETPPVEEVSTLGDEILDFYQPDEDLKLEDVFPDVDISTPEDFVAAEEELVQCVNAAVAAMPKEWRRALHLRHSGGLTLKELREVLKKDEPEIERILEYARQHLRQSLIESGCTFIVKGNENRSGLRPKAKSEKHEGK